MNARYARVSLISPPISDIRYENPHPIRSRYPIFRTLVFTGSCGGLVSMLTSLRHMSLELNQFSMSRTWVHIVLVDYLAIILDPSLSTTAGPQHFHIIRHNRHHRGDISLMRLRTFLQNEAISTADEEFRCYFIHWKGRPDSDCTWIWTKEVRQLNLDLLRTSLPFTRGEFFRPGDSWWGSNQYLKDVFE